MEAVELFPNLSDCIESVTKKEFWNSVSQYVGGGDTDKKLEERIELLRAFLESADFKKLRNQSEKHLVEGKSVKFVICWKEAEPSYEMVVTEV